MGKFSVRALTSADWAALRAARVAALEDSPESFGGDPGVEAAWAADHWIHSLAEASWAVIEAPAGPLGLIGVRPAADVDDCDCWISSWWVAPSARGAGAVEALLAWADARCAGRGWRRQGLGVWVENARAQRAFARLGFAADGGPRQSTHFPGRRYVRMLRAVPEG